MSEDFFNDLGKTITKAANDAVDKTTEFFEATKIKAQIAGEGKSIEKNYRDIGEIIYKLYTEGTPVTDEVAKICDDVCAHEEHIKSLRNDLANLKGMNLCPACEEMVDKAAAFCPKCGSSMAQEKTKEDVNEDDIIETVEAVAKEAAEEVKDTVEEVASDVEEVVSEVEETVSDVKEAAAESAEETQKAVEK